MNNNTTPKDFFLHLGATVALYAAVVALINLAFSVINYYLPDQLAGYFYAGNIAWPISMLIILVPILYVLEYLIIKDIRKLPGKESIWIRRWRIYLTLFLTGAVMVGDLIALVNTYLNGEISGRFAYKVLAVFVIAGVIFLYYLIEKKRGLDGADMGTKSNSRVIVASIGLVAALVAIIFGFIAVGSPTKQRNLRFDNQRTNDLSAIQWQIVSYWQQKGKLPTTFGDLIDPISYSKIPTDPKTKTAYEYSVKIPGNTGLSSAKPSFELCATFALPTPDNKGRGDFYGGNSYPTRIMSSAYYDGGIIVENDNWKHEAGRTCFTRTIDPDKYPVNPKGL